MEEKFRIDDVEYTIHNGPCTCGGNLLCTHWPGANEPLLSEWMSHHRANDALRRTADDFASVAGACDDTVIRQLDRMACDNQLSVTQRKIAAEDAPGVVMLVKPESKKDWWSWGEKGSDPLGLGFWEMDKLKEIDVDPDDQRHKLAVEIAGTRQLSLQGELVIASDRATIGRYDLSRGGVYGGHRLQVFINNIDPGSYRLDLRLNDYGYGRYDIPLTIAGRKAPTCPKPTSRDIWDTVLVPLLPRTYTSIHLKRDAGHADYPPQDGYIYIFLDGKLWREVQVQAHGWFADVNLAMEKDKDHRQATGWPDRTLMTPYIVQGHKPAIEICYAQTQWSWAQIEALGGMADDDPRLAKGPALKPVATGRFPFKRLQPVDLCAYPNFENGPGNVGHCRQRGEIIEARRKDLRSFFDSGLPVVYLHDALGIAESLSAQYHEKLTELRQTVADLPTLKGVVDPDPVTSRFFQDQKNAYYAAAQSAYHLFFNVKVTDGRRKASRIMRNCQANIDREILENILQVDKRRKLRVKLIIIRNKLTNWLKGKIRHRNRNSVITKAHPDFVDTMAMLADYANLNGDEYGMLWTKTAGVIGFVGHQPSHEDYGLDVGGGTAGRTVSKHPPKSGIDYLQSMLTDAHPLHFALFPTRAQVDEFEQAYLAPGQPEPADGTAVFRKGAFARLTKDYPRPPDKDLKDLIKFVKQASSDFLLCFLPRWSTSHKARPGIDCIVRLAKAADHPDLAGLHCSKGGTVKELSARALLTMGAGSARYRQILDALHGGRPAARTKTAGRSIPIDGTSKRIPIGRAAANGKGPAVFDTPRDAVSPENWNALWNAGQKGSLVVPKDSGYSKKFWHTSKSTAYAAKNILPPIVAVLEVMNFSRALTEAYTALKDDRTDPMSKTYPLIVGFGLTYYTLDAFKTVVGEKVLAGSFNSGSHKLGDFLFKTPIKVAGGKVIVFSAWSAGVSGLSGLLSYYEMAQCIDKYDHDAAIAFGVAGSASLGLALAKLGAGQVSWAASLGIPLAESGALAFLGPWGWAFLLLTIGASITAMILTDTRLEQWCKHGPFSRQIYLRWTGEYAEQRPRYVFESLLGELMRPQITIRYAGCETARGPTDVIVEVTAPGLDKRRSRLIVHTSAQKVGAVIEGVSYQRPEEPRDYNPHFMIYYRVEEIAREDGAKGLRYYYKGLSALQNRYRWRVRARHVIEQSGMTVSLPPIPDPYGHTDSLKIDNRETGWVYAEL